MPDDDVLLGTVIGSRYEDIDDEWRRLQSSRDFVMEEQRMIAQQEDQLRHSLQWHRQDRRALGNSNDHIDEDEDERKQQRPKPTARRVRISVSGHIFESTATTFLREPNSRLATLASAVLESAPVAQGTKARKRAPFASAGELGLNEADANDLGGDAEAADIHVDRDPQLFRHVLNFLRDGVLPCSAVLAAPGGHDIHQISRGGSPGRGHNRNHGLGRRRSRSPRSPRSPRSSRSPSPRGAGRRTARGRRHQLGHGARGVLGRAQTDSFDQRGQRDRGWDRNRGRGGGGSRSRSRSPGRYGGARRHSRTCGYDVDDELGFSTGGTGYDRELDEMDLDADLGIMEARSAVGGEDYGDSFGLDRQQRAGAPTMTVSAEPDVLLARLYEEARFWRLLSLQRCIEERAAKLQRRSSSSTAPSYARGGMSGQGDGSNGRAQQQEQVGPDAWWRRKPAWWPRAEPASVAVATLLDGTSGSEKSSGRVQSGTSTGSVSSSSSSMQWASTASARTVALPAETQVRPPLDDSFWRGGYARLGGGTVRASADGLGMWRRGGSGRHTMSPSRVFQQRIAATPYGA
eukprot:g1862.t1